MKTKTIKLFGKNIWKKLHDIGFGNSFLEMTQKEKASKGKIQFHQNFKLWCLKGHYRESKTKTERIGENICRSCV